MPNVRNMDISSLHQTNGWLPPPTLPVCKRAQILDRGAGRPWPFLFSYKESGSVEINRGAKKTAYQQAQEVGEALV